VTAAAVLHDRLLQVKADPSATSAARARAFEAWFRQARQDGEEPDALRRYVKDETERFWAQVISGAADHLYWNGPGGYVGSFKRNDGRSQRPARWVYEKTHGVKLAQTTDVWARCGEPRCLTPAHLEAGRLPSRLNYTRDQITGAMQVFALRNGRPPSSTDWEEAKLSPTRQVVLSRFGTWDKALEAAGLDPYKVVHRYSPVGNPVYNPDTVADLCLTAIRALARKLGRTPSSIDYQARHRDWRHENGYPSEKTLRRTFGSWNAALERAGLPLNQVGPPRR